MWPCASLFLTFLLPSSADFRVGNNRLTGTIPTFLFDFRFMFRLELNSNYMEGTIPNEIGALTQMSILRLDRNYFTGTIPTQLATSNSIALVQVQLNELLGAVPDALCAKFPFPLQVMNADCAPIGNPTNECVCCSSCCDRETEVCRINENAVAGPAPQIEDV